VRFTEIDGGQRWTGSVWTSGGPGFSYIIEQRWEGDGLSVHTTVRSASNADIEGVFLFFDLPQSFFLGGEFEFRRNGVPIHSPVRLPEQYNPVEEDPHLANTEADEIVVRDPTDRFQITMTLAQRRAVTIQDNREWGDPAYSFFFPIHSGNLRSLQEVTFTYTLAAVGDPDSSPVTLAVGEPVLGKHFDGWGGNFVFGLENCPVPEFMLTTTRTAWARTGMSLHLWEPQNDNSDPDTPDWSRFRSRIDLDDDKETELEREMRMAGRIAELGIPHIISVWYIPDWMQPEGDGSLVPEQNWPELMESVGTYLLFLRERFGAEPDYFSFNEPDLGVYVLQSPDEHARRIVQLGGYFGQLGLKTKLLLGDTANASNPAYAETAARTPGVLDYARVLAFHSWNGTTPENYRRWSELADELNLPLAVTEVGSDPAAWHFPGLFFDYGYALDDLANYFGFLIDARPQAALQWEYTCDYPLVRFQTDGVAYSARYWFVKQLADLTPSRAEYLNVDSGDPDVQVIGFRSVPDSAGDIEYVFHVANLGPARIISLEGLPASLRELTGVITTAEESFATLPTRISVAAGGAEFEQPGQSLLSLQGSRLSQTFSFSAPFRCRSRPQYADQSGVLGSGGTILRSPGFPGPTRKPHPPGFDGSRPRRSGTSSKRYGGG